MIGAVILQSVNVYRDGYYAEKDAVFRHYIELHPEDFIMPGMYSVLYYIKHIFKIDNKIKTIISLQSVKSIQKY